VRFLPDAACAGPVVRDVGENLRLVLIDTEWWLRDENLRPDDRSCAVRTQPQFVDSLKATLATAGTRSVVVTGHHPMVSGGAHGGHFTLRKHIFPLTEFKSWAWLPLPLIGSIYPIARNLGISDQDLSGPRNRRMRQSLRDAFEDNPPLLYAAGHEHNLQVHEGDGSLYHVVSGTGIFGHNNAVRWLDGTLYADGTQSGFVKLEVQRDGRVRLVIVTVDADAARSTPFSMYLETDRG
jgi:hypothetical protein